MNTLGFAGISGRLRAGRKKISWKKGAFKRVINDISGFSRETARTPLLLPSFRGGRLFPNRPAIYGTVLILKL